MGLVDRLKHSWNAFVNNRDPTGYRQDYGESYYYRPDQVRFSRGNERSIVTSVYNRIALDAAAINIQHCKLDDNGRYSETMASKLNSCLNLEANLDQTGRAFRQDIFMSLLDEGCIAIVPVETTLNPNVTGSYDILSMRTGKIIEWKAKHVRVRVYNEQTAKKEELILPKSSVAIIESPLRAVINEPSSNMQRQRAEARRKDIEDQLKGPYGIAYTDGTERITQLNRPIETNLMKQIEYLTSMLYSQLGITQSILDGTADEKAMLNYYDRTIEPLVSAVVDEMKRKFLTKTARSQKQTILYFRDPFKLVPVNDLAEIADKFTRNEIMTSNEIRQVVGMKPSKDPKADQLINSNLNHPEEPPPAEAPKEEIKEGEEQNAG